MAFIQKIARDLTQQIVKNRKYNYSFQQLDNFLYNNPNINCNHFSLKNKRGQTISAMVLKKSISDTCIVYAHGLGSNKLQVIPVAHHFIDLPYNICSFDFSGSGRSQGNNTTYGLQQQDDVNAVLGWLDATRQYQKYILWGRSMGGASIILSQAKITNQKIQCIVLDSSFSSFQKVALQIASKASYVPGFVLSILMQPLRNQFSRSMNNLNPFKIDVCLAASKIQKKVILIYSKNDKIVSYQHSKQISKCCKKSPAQIEIEQDHNKPRKKQTYQKVNSFIQDSMKQYKKKVRRSRSKSRGISVTSKDSSKKINYRNSICQSVFTDKSCNTDMFSMDNGSIEFTPANTKKSAIIKSILLKSQNGKSYSFFEMPDKQNQRATINYQRKFKNSVLGCFK